MKNDELKIECKQIHKHQVPTGILAMDILPETDRGFFACMDGVYEMSLESGESQLLYSHDSYASGVVCIHENGQLVSAGYDGRIKWFDLETKSVVRSIEAHSFWSWNLTRAKNKPVVASVTGQYRAGSYEYHPKPSDEPCVRVYDALTGQLLSEFEHLPPVQAVALTGDGQHVAAGNLMGQVGVWQVGGERVATWKTDDFTAFGIIKSHCQIGGIYAAEFTDDDQLLIAGMGPMRDPMAGNGKMRWRQIDWKSDQAQQVAQSDDKKAGEGLMETLAIAPDGSHFVMAGRLKGGSWNVGLFAMNAAEDEAQPGKGGKLLHSFELKKRVTSARFSADGKRLYLAGAVGQGEKPDKKFGRLHVYDVAVSNSPS